MLLPLGLLSWMLIGLWTGVAGRWLLPGEPSLGLLAALSSGLAGSLIGGLLATLLGFGGLAGFDYRALVAATLCAILALLLLRTAKLTRE